MKQYTKFIFPALAALFLILFLSQYMSPSNREAREISGENKLSAKILDGIDIIKTENQIRSLKAQLIRDTKCKEYNESRMGTMDKAKTCDNFHVETTAPEVQLEVGGHDEEHEKHAQSHVVLAKPIMNLPGCRRTQGEHNHIKPFVKGQGGGDVYATDIACTKGESFKVYATSHEKEYVVDYNGYLKGGTGNTLVLKAGNKFYLYGHTDSNLKKGDIVKEKDSVGVSDRSGESSNYHLHFELWDGNNNVSSTGDINPKSQWLLNKRWAITKESITDYLTRHSASFLEQPILDSAKEHNLKPEMLVCITKAETNVGSKLKTPHNYGNIGNNDRGDTVGYETAKDGIDAIARMLSKGTYLKGNMTIKDLATTGPTEDTKQYASDPNWSNNILDCLGKLHKEAITKDYIYKK